MRRKPLPAVFAELEESLRTEEGSKPKTVSSDPRTIVYPFQNRWRKTSALVELGFAHSCTSLITEALYEHIGACLAALRELEAT